MDRFHSAFNQTSQKLTPEQLKARQRAAAKLAAAAGFGIERLEERALFTVLPVANPGGPYSVNEGSSITLDGTGSTDPNGGTITTYEWDLHYNGTFVDQTEGAHISYTAGAAKAPVTIALEVLDSNSLTSTPVTTTITTNDVLPAISVSGGGGTVNRGTAVPITWSYVDPGNETVNSWVVNWGDGTTSDTLAGTANSDSHIYSADGPFTITVTSSQTVLNNPVTSNGTTSVTIAPVHPVITPTGNATVNELATYTLGFSATDPSGIDSWAINWGDGSQAQVLPGSATGATHAYATHGSYTIALTAIDNAGDSSQVTKSITALDVPPAPTISGSVSPISEGGTISLSVAGNDPGSLGGNTYLWSVTSTNPLFLVPGGTNLTSSTLSFVAGYAGSLTATCVVTDDAGQTGSASTSAITVNAVQPGVTISGTPGSDINKGDTISVTANPTSPATSDTFTYSWAVTLGGVNYPLTGNATATAQNLVFVAGRAGNFDATVTVTDRDSETNSASTGTIHANDVNPTLAITGEASPINEGTAVSLTATPTDLGTNESFTYSWSVTKDTGSGPQTFHLPAPIDPTLATLTFTPEDEGSYIATCTVTDLDGGTATQSSTAITVNDANPTVAITGAPLSTSPEGTAITLTATPTEASNDRTYTYSWSVSRNFNGATTNLTLPNGTTDQAQFTFTPPTEGTYVASVLVTDDEGGFASPYTGDMVVSNVAPTATITGTPASAINEGTAVSLAASSTEPGSGHTFSYSWDVTQNGNPYTISVSASPTLGFTPTTDGSYVATVTSTDEDGHTGTQTADFTVNNVPPTVTVSGEPGTSIVEGTPVSLTSTETEPGAGDYTYAWTLSNGDTAVSLAGNATASTDALSFTPLVEGSYVATLTVTDGEGGSTPVSSTPITVAAAAPTATMTGLPISTPTEFTPITLGVTSSDVNPANTDTYLWSVNKFGSPYTLPLGTAVTGNSFTFTPTDSGDWAVNCVVTNSEGQSTTVHSGTFSVALTDPTPSITVATGPYVEGTAISATSTVADVGDSDTAFYHWSVQRDGVAYTLPQSVVTAGSTFSFTPGDEGSYVISLGVNDNGGATTTSSSALTVADAAPAVAITGAPAGNATAPEGTTLNLGTTVTQVGANDSVATYLWSVTKDGQPLDLSAENTTSSSLALLPTNAGTYVATVVVTNASDGSIPGASTTQTSTINVVNVPPTVNVSTSTPGPVTNGSTLSFSATASEPGSNTLGYAWTITRTVGGTTSAFTPQAGTSLTSSSLTFAPGLAGTYIATCTVTDSESGTNQAASSSVTVTDVAPTVTISAPGSNPISAGTPVNLSAVATDPGLGESFTYVWTVTSTNNSFTLPSTVALDNSSLSFTPDRVGTYTASVVVTDTDGGATTQSATAIGVTDVAPTVTVTGPVASVDEGQSISFVGSATNPTVGDTFSYSWSVTRGGNAFTLPNGTSATGSTLSFIAPQGGTYVATASVTDSAQSVGTGSGSATVNWLSPSVAISGAPTHGVSLGSAVSLSAAPTEVGSRHTYTYAWSVTRNGLPYTLPIGVSVTGSSFSFNPGRAGSFIATVVATDEDTQTATASTASIQVGDVAPAVGISGAPLAMIPEGQSISLTASPTSPGADETFTYQWTVTKGGLAYTLPDGTVTTAAELDFTPGVAGSYVATVSVTDLDSGVTSVSTQAMVVSPTAATVVVSGAPGTTINAGTAVNLSAAATNSGPGEQFSYVWSVTLNGQTYTLPHGTAVNAASFSFTTTDAGLYVATCVATDTSGQAGSGNSGNVIVDAVTPTVTITNAPIAPVNEGSSVTLTAAPADANTADTYTYSWSVTANGNTFTLPSGSTTGQSLTFTPNDVGTFVATVTVTDKASLSASTSATITSSDVAPTVSITGGPTAPVNVGTPISFTGATSSIGASDTISQLAWTVTKDGNSYTPPGSPSASGSMFGFTPDGAGAYVVTLNATDNYSQTGAISTSSIIVRPVAPTVVVSGTSGTVSEGATVSLSAAATDPSTGDTYSYAWSVTKDGLPIALPSFESDLFTYSFVPPSSGTYVASVAVTDASDLTTMQQSSPITATAVAPTVTVTGAPSTSDDSTPINLSAVVSEPGSGHTYTYAWSVTRNGLNYVLPQNVGVSGSSLNFTPGTAGVFVASVTVTNGDLLTGSGSGAQTTVTDVNQTVAISGAPTTAVPEGSSTVLGSVVSTPATGETVTNTWSVELADSQGNYYVVPQTAATHGSSFTFTPTQPGSYLVILNTSDGDGGTGLDEKALTVTAVNPTVTITPADNDVNEGQLQQFTANVTSPRTNNSYTYLWSITSDNPAFTVPANLGLTSQYLYFTPVYKGNYTITCAVTDVDQATGSGSTTLSVSNVAPTLAPIQGAPASPGANVGDSYSFSVAPTEPGPGGYTYAWTLTQGDQTIATSTSPTFSGVYGLQASATDVVNVTVTDSEGGSATATASFLVNDVAPTVALTGAPTTSPEGTAIPLGRTATDVGTQFGETLTDDWSVTLNNISQEVTSNTSPSFSFTPNQPGTYVVTDTVDTSEGSSTAASSTITVSSVGPTVAITGASVNPVSEGLPVTLNVAPSSPRINDTYTYLWAVSLGGQAYSTGTTTSASQFTFTPNQPGTYSVSCTVSDVDDASTTATASVLVARVNPSVTLSGAPTSSTPEGTVINLTAHPSSPRTSDSYTYAWSATLNGQTVTLPFGDVADTAAFSFTPTVAGSYVFTVVTTDVDGGTNTSQTQPITVTNVPPTVSILGLPSTAISTGAQYALTAQASEPGAGVYTYLWTVTKNGNPVLTGTNPTLSGLGGLSGTYNVALAVTDGEGGVGTAAGTINVSDVAPTVTVTGAPSGNSPEGTPISLAANAVDPGATFGETLSYAWAVTRNGTAYPVANAQAPSLTFTPDIYGTYVATLTVTDSQGGSTPTSTTVNVTNVAPTTSLAAVGTVLRNSPVTFSGSFTDPSTVDTHTIVWNYGDGTSQTFAATAANALTPTHTYTTPGNYTASVTVTDSGGLSSASSQAVTVAGAMLTADPFAAGKTALEVTGTTGNDTVKFYTEPGNRVKVVVDGATLGTFAPTGHIIARGVGSGTDSVSVQSTITIPTVLYGNAGTDTLYGGGGNNILVAGAGKDSLVGGPGADILIGGSGKDVLTAGAGQDLLIGGNSPFASNQAGLAAIAAEWTRTDASFATIVHQLRGTAAGTLSGSYLVNGSALTSVGSGETLIVGAGRDWIVTGGSDAVQNYTASRDVETIVTVSTANTRKK